MIVDTFENIGLYAAVHPEIPKLLAALGTLDLTAAGAGKYPVPEAETYFMVQHNRTKPVGEGFWEAHRKYIDLQFVVSGNELIGYQHIDELDVTDPYDEARDAAFYRGAGTLVPVRTGMFMLLFPQDAHMPGIGIDGPENVIKVVAKLPVSALG